MAEGSVSVELSVDEQKALKALTSLTQKFDSFGKNAEKTIKKTDMAFASFAGNLAASAVSKGFSLLASGIKNIVFSVDDLIGAAANQEKVLNELNTALAISGKFSKEASKDFQDFASNIQNTTGVGDEAVLALGAQIQNISRVSVDELKKATEATIQFSSALGIDLNSAGTLVGKALEGNVASLQRYGLSVKKGATDTETFNNVVNALGAFSGTAESKLNTFAGSFAAFRGRVGDLNESIGTIIIQSPAVVAAIKGFEKGIFFLDKVIKENSGAIREFTTQAILGLVNSLKVAADIFAFFNKGFAGFEITGKIFQQALFGIDIALSNFNLGLDTVIGKIQEYTGLDLGAGQEAFRQAQEASIANSREQISAIDSEITAIANRTTAQNNAVKNFADVVVNETNRAIQAQATAQEEGNTKYLEQLNARNQIAVQKEQEQIDALSLLRMTNKENDKINAQTELLEKQLAADAEFQFLAENLGKEEALREVARATELSKTAGHNAAVLQLRAARVKAEQNQVFALQRYEDLSNKQRLDNLKSTFGIMANLQSSSSKELFMIGKASALAIATVDGIQAIQKALASAPPPFNYALAAAVGVVQASNLAKIASAKQGGMENGGIVGGSSTFGDKISMNLNSREMVLNRQQQTKLFNDINNGGNSGNVVQAINNLGDRIARMNIVVQANSREIARLVRDEREAGFAV